MNGIKNVFSKLGVCISAEKQNGTVYGKGLIYPLKYYQQRKSRLQYGREGKSEEKLYLLLCDKGFLAGADDRTVIRDESGERYRMLWMDDFSCGIGAYTKACLRKITEVEDNA